MHLTTSQRGLALIKSFESFSPTLYLCPAGKPTIGYGHVVRGAGIDEPITESQAVALLADDCRTVEIYLNAINLPAPLTQHEFDALVSFCFNVGLGAFDKSTMLKKLKAGAITGAANEFLRWDNVNGKPLAGLTRRRKAERDLFLEKPA